MNTEQKVSEIKSLFEEKVKSVNDMKSLNELRVEFLGKKGIITELSSIMKDLDNEQKKEFDCKTCTDSCAGTCDADVCSRGRLRL